jgi:two-component system, LytTR family, sensor kinase
MKHSVERFKSLYPEWYKYIAIVITVSIAIGYLCTFAFGLQLTFLQIIFNSIVSSGLIWGGCIVIVGFVWKKFPWEYQPIIHLFTEISLILLYLAIYISIFNLLLMQKTGISFRAGIEANRSDIVFTVLVTFLITTIHEALFFYKQWKFNFSKSVSLEKDNLEARYNSLKSQVNPHFLFNSLNSLMSLLENNPKAEEYVQNLSEYLRYVLLSSSRETVTLQEELENVEKYIDLQKLRFGENFVVEVSVNTASLQMMIPPLALQMLVENCVQHNIIAKSHPLKVHLFDDEKRITVVNNLQKKNDHESTGHGLKNIEGRYRFAEEGNIKIESDERFFTVSIPLLKNKN